MQEQRSAQSSDLAAFKDGWDEYDFADLVVKDHMWSALYNDQVDSVEELAAAEREQLALDIIEAPDFSNHITGYVYYRETSLPPSIGGILNRLTPYVHDRTPRAVRQAVYGKMDELIGEQVLARIVSSHSGMFQAGPQFPREQFPQLEGFEERTSQFIRSCGGEALSRIVILECVDNPQEPFHFWAGIRKIFEMRQSGLLARSGGYISLRQETNALGEFIGVAEQSLEEKLRSLQLRSPRRFKPHQRDRDPKHR